MALLLTVDTYTSPKVKLGKLFEDDSKLHRIKLGTASIYNDPFPETICDIGKYVIYLVTKLR